MESRFERLMDRLSCALTRRTGSALFVASLIIIGAALMTFYLRADIDLFTKVKVGGLVWERGEVLREDTFAFTARKPVWHDHEWLSGVVFFLVSRQGGDLGLFLLKLVFFGATLLLLYRSQTYGGNRAAGLALLGLVLPDLANVWLPTIRSHSFSYLSYAFFLLAFARWRATHQPGPLFVLPLLMVVWVNTHGGFIVGLVIAWIFAAAHLIGKTSLREKLYPLAAALGCSAASFINPYQFSLHQFILSVAANPPSLVQEWAKVPLFSGQALLLSVLSLSLVIGCLKGARLPLEAYGILGLTLLEGILHRRFTPFFTMAVASYGTMHFQASIQALDGTRYQIATLLRRSMLLLWLLAATLAPLRLVYFFFENRPFSLSCQGYPAAAVAWLSENRRGGNILLHFNYGSYALSKLTPRFRVSLDSRYLDLYPQETVETVLGALDSVNPRQQEYVRSLRPDFVLLETQSFEYEQHEALFPGYIPVHQDNDFSVLERGSRAAALIGQD